MKVSVIIPVYNMADGKIQRCLDSLLAQTVLNNNCVGLEIICVDDCSTDNSMEVLNDYASKYKGLIFAYHSEQNHKQGGARNLGFSKSKGDYICMVDADDWVSPEYVEKLYKKAEETQADIVACNYCISDKFSFEVKNASDIECADKSFTAQKKNALLKAGPCFIKIYRRKFLLGERDNENYEVFPSDMFFEDNAVTINTLLRMKSYATVSDVLYFYYQNPTSTVHTFSWQKMQDRMKAGIMLIEGAQKESFYKDFEEEVNWRFFELFYMNTYIITSHQKKCNEMRDCFYQLSDGIKKWCPNWKKNKYYRCIAGGGTLVG